jgi:hypothetical protein
MVFDGIPAQLFNGISMSIPIVFNEYSMVFRLYSIVFNGIQ